MRDIVRRRESKAAFKREREKLSESQRENLRTRRKKGRLIGMTYTYETTEKSVEGRGN